MKKLLFVLIAIVGIIAIALVIFRYTSKEAGYQGGLTDGSRVSLEIGESKTIGTYTLRFTSVEQDSRCPSDVQCITAGSVTAHFNLDRAVDGRTISLPLSFTLPGNSMTAIDQYILQLTEVKPYPTSKKPIDKKSYEATLIIDTKN